VTWTPALPDPGRGFLDPWGLDLYNRGLAKERLVVT
jgi:hypothetical protein